MLKSLISLFFLFVGLLNAQISGIVSDIDTGEPLPGVTISSPDSSFSISSDELGEFRIESKLQDSLSLVFSLSGYEEMRLFIRNEELPSGTIHIRLKPALIQLREEVVITAARQKRNLSDTPESVNTISREEIEILSPRSTPELLMGENGIWVQKTNHGSGSPFIRGLTGVQTLILIDGIRLNNAGFRYGPNQYLSTIDPGLIDRAEVLRGSGSVLYGSDAIGGVIQVFSRRNRFSTDGFKTHTQISGKITSSGMEKSTHAEGEFYSERFSLIGGLSLRDFGDIIAGADKGFEVPTGYKEFSGDMKIAVRPFINGRLTFAYQYHRQEDVPRYDQVVQRGYEFYNFNPQLRELGYVNFESFHDNNWFSKIGFTASNHVSDEKRSYRKQSSAITINENDRIITRGAILQIDSNPSGDWNMVSGAEFYWDKISSSALETNTENQSVFSKRGLYPDNSKSENFSLYNSHWFKLGKLRLSAGLRVNFVSNFINDPEFGDVNTSANAFVWNINGIYKLTGSLVMIAGLNSGFRAPNINDLSTFGKFDFGIEVPADNLSPEKSLAAETGFRYFGKLFNAEAVFYRLSLFDLIERTPAEYQGSQEYQGEKVYKKVNLGEGYIQGFELEGEFIFGKFDLNAFVFYTFGKNLTQNEPLRRIPPLSGGVEVNFRASECINLGAEWLSAGVQDRLAEGDISDHRIPAGGTPGWNLFHLRSSISLDPFTVSIAAENIFNRLYRLHGSGIDGPGRHFWLSGSFRY